MNNLLRLFTLVGTGLILGSVTSQFIKANRLKINRILRFGDDANKGMNKGKHEALPVPQEELENCFI